MKLITTAWLAVFLNPSQGVVPNVKSIQEASTLQYKSDEVWSSTLRTQLREVQNVVSSKQASGDVNAQALLSSGNGDPPLPDSLIQAYKLYEVPSSNYQSSGDPVSVPTSPAGTVARAALQITPVFELENLLDQLLPSGYTRSVTTRAKFLQLANDSISNHGQGKGIPAVFEGAITDHIESLMQDTWMASLLKYDEEVDEYIYTCDRSSVNAQEQPIRDELLHENPAYFSQGPLIDGADSFLNDPSLRFRFQLRQGQLKRVEDQLSQTQSEQLLSCLSSTSQYYHVALHHATEYMSYASQDFSPSFSNWLWRQSDPVWAVFNPTPQQSAVTSLQASALLTQSGTQYIRGILYAAPLQMIRMRVLIFDMLLKPCDPSRYMPVGIPDDHRRYFVPTLQRAQSMVCAATVKMDMKPETLSFYKNRLKELYPGYGNIESMTDGLPSASAAMIGIEHTMQFAIGFLNAPFDGRESWQIDGEHNLLFTRIALATLKASTACFNPPEISTSSLPFNELLSVTSQMKLLAAYLGREQGTQWSEAYNHLASELESLWREVDAGPVNATFVFQSGSCQTSTTWV